MLRLLVVAFSLVPTAAALGQGGVGNAEVSRSSSRAASEAVAATQAFLSQWFEAWKRSEDVRNEYYVGTADRGSGAGAFHVLPLSGRILRPYAEEPPRYIAYLCTRGWAPEKIFGDRIRSRFSPFGVCPGWYRGVVGGAEGVADERLWIDNALIGEQRGRIHAARAQLLVLLDSATRAVPQDEWLHGQFVRFLVDQREFDRAAAILRTCATAEWWCAALGGYASSASGKYQAADSLFAVAAAAMPVSERCKWGDHTVLLEPANRAAYSGLMCTARESVNTWLWWLADPLWVMPGNERRVQQFHRQMLIRLRSALDRDERYDWRDSTGNDARREMILRYGWPSYAFWGGPNGDTTASNFQIQDEAPRNYPATTYEYTSGRHRMIPRFPVLRNPLAARAVDWSFASPVGGDSGIMRYPVWWPREHYAPPFPLVELGEGQTALLRRSTHAILAMATDLDATLLQRAPGEPISDVWLVATSKPETLQVVARRAGVAGQPIVLRGPIRTDSTLIGLEILPGREVPAARLRFGLAPPAPLSAMRPGEVAISPPVILRNWPDTEPPNPETDAALDRMASSTVLAAGSRMGVYWETYGVAPTDTVHVTVSVERTSGEGGLRRLGQMLRLTGARSALVEVGWEEPLPGQRVHVIPGDVPIIGRSVLLDVSLLAPGEYRLRVAVERRGGPVVSDQRPFAIR